MLHWATKALKASSASSRVPISQLRSLGSSSWKPILVGARSPSCFTASRPYHQSPISYKSKYKMPPKKAVVEKKALLGRPSNNLKVGIVGMPK